MKVNVKWNREQFKDIDVDQDQPPHVFKTQLYTLSNVPPERQKILIKGKVLNDDEWNNIQLKSGQTIMMMGTADVIEEPETEIKFIEDMPEEEQENIETKQFGAGLANLGNTCYMNSTLQCLYSVDKLKQKLLEFDDTSEDPRVKLTLTTKQLFQQLSNSGVPQEPTQFWIWLRNIFPQFGQIDQQRGEYMQQDAEECWSQLLTVYRETLQGRDGDQTSGINDIFGITYEMSLKCAESGEEIKETTKEVVLKCNIDIGVDFLQQGIALALKADREQMSQKLGKELLFEGNQVIASLPQFLSVQLVRFFYKATAKQKAKILRKVTFPMQLDVYDFCSDELKQKLDRPRSAQKALDEAAQGVGLKPKVAVVEGTKPSSSKKGEEKAEETASVIAKVDNPQEFLGQQTGRYELHAVLTHKGRSADSGHYVAWVKQNDGQWVEFDDDTLRFRKQEEILALSGGGDWHMAYILLYKECLVEDPQAEKRKEDELKKAKEEQQSKEEAAPMEVDQS